MRYLLAVFVPPLAVLLCGKPIQAVINAILFVAGIPLSVAGIGIGMILAAIVHAILVVNARLADNRNKQLIRAVERSKSG